MHTKKKHCHRCHAGEGKKPQRLREGNPWKKTKGENGLYKPAEANPSRGESPEDKSWSSLMGVRHRASDSILERTIFAMKSQPSIAGWIFGKRTRQRKRMKTTEFNIMLWKVSKSCKLKTGRKQLRIEELGETWLRTRKTTKGYSAKWWWWLSCNGTVSTTKDAKCYWDVPNGYELQVRDDRSIQGALFWHMFARTEENHKASNRNSGYGSLANMKIVQPAVSRPFVSAECIKTDI